MDLPLAISAFEWLENAISGEIWTYPAIVAAVALDSLLPVAPGETVVITAGVLAANGDLNPLLVVCAGMAGSLLGDNCSYGLGASLGRRAERRFFSSAKAQRRTAWARRQLDERGAVIIVIARFVPGGRTATTFSAGALEMPWRRFVAADAVAAVLWATYMTMLGYFGGSAFEESLWKPMLAGSRRGAAASRPPLLATLPASAPWRSGYAAACKAVYTGSIPVGASVAAMVPLAEADAAVTVAALLPGVVELLGDGELGESLEHGLCLPRRRRRKTAS
jgi:membrane-associated protein